MSNVNPKTDIRYGVLDARNVMDLYEEITTNGTDETFEAHKQECIKTIAAALEECGQRDAQQQAQDIVGNFEWDNYQADESDYSYEDNEGNRFQLSYLGGAPLIWCIQTNNIVKVDRLCSPCVPNAGDLNSGMVVNGYECYGIPESWQQEAE